MTQDNLYKELLVASDIFFASPFSCKTRSSEKKEFVKFGVWMPCDPPLLLLVRLPEEIEREPAGKRNIQVTKSEE